MSSSNIFPEYEKQLSQEEKESLLKQKGAVIWLYGLSGSGKSTLANALEKKLHSEGKLVSILDGDNLRSGLNQGLSFSDEDRKENIRRASEVAKILRHNGLITIVSLITPQSIFREQARSILQDGKFLEVYIQSSFETCQERDVKGLYAKQKEGKVSNFSGTTSTFEEPTSADVIINTESNEITESLETLYKRVISLINQ